jgi:hypothetical protein
MERFVLDQAQRVTHGAMNIINNHNALRSINTPNYRGEPHYCKVPERVWLARLDLSLGKVI